MRTCKTRRQCQHTHRSSSSSSSYPPPLWMERSAHWAGKHSRGSHEILQRFMTQWVGPAFHGETIPLGGAPALSQKTKRLSLDMYTYVCTSCKFRWCTGAHPWYGSHHGKQRPHPVSCWQLRHQHISRSSLHKRSGDHARDIIQHTPCIIYHISQVI